MPDDYPTIIRKIKNKEPNNDNWVYLLLAAAAVVMTILAYSLLK